MVLPDLHVGLNGLCHNHITLKPEGSTCFSCTCIRITSWSLGSPHLNMVDLVSKQKLEIEKKLFIFFISTWVAHSWQFYNSYCWSQDDRLLIRSCLDDSQPYIKLLSTTIKHIQILNQIMIDDHCESVPLHSLLNRAMTKCVISYWVSIYKNHLYLQWHVLFFTTTIACMILQLLTQYGNHSISS